MERSRHMVGCRLHADVLARSSQLMLRSFLLSLFAGVEVTLRDKRLYCDALCEHGPAVAGKQVSMNQSISHKNQIAHSVTSGLQKRKTLESY